MSEPLFDDLVLNIVEEIGWSSPFEFVDYYRQVFRMVKKRDCWFSDVDIKDETLCNKIYALEFEPW